MVSSIKLTGEYIDSNGNATTIDTTKNVKIEWVANDITQEEVELTQEVITNKLYNIEGTNKRIVQVLLKSNIIENKAPVKSTKIEIQEPQIGVKPEQVKITAKNTLATNGKTNVEFGNLVDSKYEYKQEEGKTYIEILNNVDEENNISWEKNANDEIIVTYIYNEETQIIPFTSKAKSTIELYGKNEAIEKENELTLENIETVGDINTLESAITNNIYKGNMYIGEETNYETAWSVFVSYSELANKITLTDTSVQETEQIATYYKTTKISKTEAINLFGEEGTIKVYNAEDLSTPIAEKKLSEETEEYITINYGTNVKQIVIETTKAVKEGKLEILNEKAIKVLKTEGIEEISELTSEIKLLVLDGAGDTITTATKSAVANLLEPKTEIEVNLDKSEISNQTENAVRLTAVLKSADNSNKLFKNPTINVEFPKEITDVSLENKALLYDEELKIKTAEIGTNENGNKVLKIELEGEQTKYNASTAQGGANIVVDLKLKADNFMANKNVEVKTTCINGADNAEKANNITILAKTGILNKSTIKVGDNVVENINSNTITSIINNNSEIIIGEKLINNNGQKIENTNIIGNLPNGLILNSELATNSENAKIYYTNKEEPTAEDWAETVESLNSVKAFKIEIGDFEQGDYIEFAYKIKIDETAINEKESFENIININYSLNEAKQDKITFKLINMLSEENSQLSASTQENNIVMTVKPKVTSQTFHEGQIVTYELKVTNLNSEAINNAVLKYEIPEGAVYTELTYAQGSEITFTDDEELNVVEWNIETIASNETITKEATIKIKNGAEKIASKAILESEKGNVEVSTTSINVQKSKLEVRLSKIGNMMISLNENESLENYVLIKNITNETINNVEVSAKIPDGTTYVKDSEYNENWTYNAENNTVSQTINSIQPNETAKLIFEVKINNLNKGATSTSIENIITAKEGTNLYESNRLTSYVKTAKWQIEQKAEHSATINDGENIKYIIEVKNVGERGDVVCLKDNVSEQIKINKVSIYMNGGLINTNELIYDNKLEFDEYVSENGVLKIEIEGTTFKLADDEKSVEIKNLVEIIKNNGETLKSNEIINTIINSDWEEPEKEPEINTGAEETIDPGEFPDPGQTETPGTEDPETPIEPGTEDPENPVDPGTEDPEIPVDPGTEEPPTDYPPEEEPENTYSISGLAWLDENKNGIRDNNEDILQGIEVILLDSNGKIVTNEEQKEFSTVTGITGTYKFTDIPKGEYIVAFKYDNTKYTVTKYQVEGAEEAQNSDAISKQLTINNETNLMGVTDEIKIEDKNIENIDIGLIKNERFDLSLEKYVSKVVVTNSTESVNYDFGETTLAKVEIAAKRLAGSTILVQYEIKISNDGDVLGYVSDLLDYMPKELEFNSEMNPDWFLDSNGILHNNMLEETAIEPGKTQTVKLILTKTLSSNSTGTIENTAELGQVTNLEELKDIDSTPANKEKGEDDIGSASLIISIKTGGPALYIGIVIISLIVLGAGIYLINKKVLKEGGEV